MTTEPIEQVDPTEPSSPPPPPPTRRRVAVTIALAWLPAIIAAAAFPQYVPVFGRWKGELPPLTAALMPLGRLGMWWIALIGAGVVGAAAVLYVWWVGAGLPGRRGLAFVLAATGLVVFAVMLAAELGPMLTGNPLAR